MRARCGWVVDALEEQSEEKRLDWRQQQEDGAAAGRKMGGGVRMGGFKCTEREFASFTTCS